MRRWIVSLVGTFALLGGATSASAQTQLEVTCSMVCSTTKARAVQAHVFVTGPTTEARLELTAFPGGFASGRSAQLGLGGERVVPRRGAGLDELSSPPHEVRVVHSGGDPSAPTAAASGALFVLEGVEPGLNYSFRAHVRGQNGDWLLSEPAQCTVPTCPSDKRERR